jgi:molybdate transport system regulatory protein
MPKKSEIRARLRIILGEEIALGPGKFELLKMVAQTGSITKASGELEMSYMRAWTLIRIMNRCFREPLVIAARGGSKGGGGAQLTDAGRKVLALYEQMNAKSLAAAQPEWGKLQKLLRS